MDYKEKVIELLKSKELNKEEKEKLANIFPELAESDDERIRKEIIAFLIYYHTGQGNSVKYDDDWIAWLEKQGEQNIGISEATKKKLEDNLNKALEKETPESWNEFLAKQGEQKPILDVEIPFGAKDSELEEVSYDIPKGYHAEIEDNKVVIKKGEQKPAEWHREDEQNLNACLGYIPDEFLRRWLTDIIHVKYDKSNNKVESNLLTVERAKEMSPFMRSGFENKSATWSEEDIVAIDCAVEVLSKDLPSLAASIERLKSLRPHNKWKPSDEQIRILELAIDYWKPDDVSVTTLLYNLLEQLKKLMLE